MEEKENGIDKAKHMELELGLRIDRRARENTIQFIQTDNTFVLILYLPGVEKHEIDIAINDEGTQISITRRGGRSFRENLVLGPLGFETKLEVGWFHKVFWIPNGVDVDRISAKIEEDQEILSIYMPKSSRQEEESKDGVQEAVRSESDDEEFEEAKDEEIVQDTEDSELPGEIDTKEITSDRDSLKPEKLDFKEIEIEETLMRDGDEENMQEEYLDVIVYSEESENEENNLEMKDEEETLETEEIFPKEIQHEEEIPLTPDKDNEQVGEFGTEEIQKEVDIDSEQCTDDSNNNQEEETENQEENQGSEKMQGKENNMSSEENVEKDSAKSEEPKKEPGNEELIYEKDREKNPGETQKSTLHENEENTFPIDVNQQEPTQQEEGDEDKPLPLSSEQEPPPETIPNKEHDKPQEISSASDRIQDEPLQPEQPEDDEASSTAQESSLDVILNKEYDKPENNVPSVNGDEDGLPQPEQLQMKESAMPTPEHEPLPDTIQEKEEEKQEKIDTSTNLDREEHLKQAEPHGNDTSRLRQEEHKEQEAENIQKEDQKLPEPTGSVPEDKKTDLEAPGAAEMVKSNALLEEEEEELDKWAELNGEKINGGNGGWPGWGWRGGKRRPPLPSSSLLMGLAFILSLSVLVLHLMKKEKNRQ